MINSKCSENNGAKGLIEMLEVKHNVKFPKASKEFWIDELKHFSAKQLKQAYKGFKNEYSALPYGLCISDALIKQLGRVIPDTSCKDIKLDFNGKGSPFVGLSSEQRVKAAELYADGKTGTLRQAVEMVRDCFEGLQNAP